MTKKKTTIIKTWGIPDGALFHAFTGMLISIPLEGMDGAEEIINYVKHMRHIINCVLPKAINEKPKITLNNVEYSIENLAQTLQTKTLIEEGQMILKNTIKIIEKINPELGLYLELME